MKINNICIKNFKGIENTTFDLYKKPNNNVYTLVGINESGKTTILEAIDYFIYSEEKGVKSISNTIKPNLDDIIPVSKRANFNDNIEIVITLEFEENDREDLKNFVKREFKFDIENKIDQIVIAQQYKYENTRFISQELLWSLHIEGRRARGRKTISLEIEQWEKAIDYLSNKLPRILYFPTTLFDLPNKIYLSNIKTEDYKSLFYKDVIQDVLDSMDNNLDIEKHIIDRYNVLSDSDKKNLKQLALEMSNQITKVILLEWKKVLDKEIKIEIDIDKDSTGIYIEFKIVENEGYYSLSERSLGFRWFFVFLLLTQFRGFRKSENKQVIFLFDEPAANLSQKAQGHLMKSLESISDKCTIIYTTHSQHLINPKWLEDAFVVSNESYDEEDEMSYTSTSTNIKMTRYREFVNSNPHKTSYFQPILDVLEYAPSDLEICKPAILLEGKNDYYTINYIFQVLLGKTEIILVPGTSCGNIDVLISLYIGWGKQFSVLLDSDKEGRTSKDRYIAKFGEIVNNKIFTLADVDESWMNLELEELFSEDERLYLQKQCFPDTDKYSKKIFNKSIQELFMKNQVVKISEQLMNKFVKIYDYLYNALY